MQKQYGKKMDAKVVMKGWEIKLAGKYTVDQVLYALDQYTNQHDDFPTPANIIQILEPEKPRITQAQYIQACKEYEAGGYNKYSDAGLLKRAYEKQEDEDSAAFKEKKDHVALLGQSNLGIAYLGDES